MKTHRVILALVFGLAAAAAVRADPGGWRQIGPTGAMVKGYRLGLQLSSP